MHDLDQLVVGYAIMIRKFAYIATLDFRGFRVQKVAKINIFATCPASRESFTSSFFSFTYSV